MNRTAEQNLSCLPAPLSDELRRVMAEPNDVTYCSKRARSGHVITGEYVRGLPRFYHSTYDPIREAQRLSDRVAADTAIVIGFGTGYHLRELLRIANRVIVVEPDIRSLAYTLRHVELHTLLCDPALAFVAGSAVTDLGANLASAYIPALHGSAAVVELTGRTGTQPDGFAALRSAIRTALDTIADDFAVQARFGRLWFRHSLVNVARLSHGMRRSDGTSLRGAYPDLRGQPVVVTAAGPSLTAELNSLRTDSRSYVLATDTSLPTLMAAGITPHAVLSIDCQPTSYLHYLGAGYPDTRVFADLAVAPSVARSAATFAPLLSRHPLHQVLSTLGLSLPHYDSSGGNVTHAATALAASAGAASVTVVGADFAYPLGACYARSSYIHTHFRLRSDRTHPTSSLLYRFAHDRPGVFHDDENPSTLRDPKLDRYAEALRSFAATTPIPVTVRGGQAAMTSTGFQAFAPPRYGELVGREPQVPADILSRLRRAFSTAGSPTSWSPADLTMAPGALPERHAVLLALLPLAAWQRRVSRATDIVDILQAAYEQAMTVVKRCNPEE